jgi:hypothetical protein
MKQHLPVKKGVCSLRNEAILTSEERCRFREPAVQHQACFPRVLRAPHGAHPMGQSRIKDSESVEFWLDKCYLHCRTSSLYNVVLASLHSSIDWFLAFLSVTQSGTSVFVQRTLNSVSHTLLVGQSWLHKTKLLMKFLAVRIHLHESQP